MVDEVLADSRAGIAVVRPPGHHAEQVGRERGEGGNSVSNIVSNLAVSLVEADVGTVFFSVLRIRIRGPVPF